MHSLSQCLAKAGDLLDPALVDRVILRADELESRGASPEAAAKRAVQEAIESGVPAREELETAIKEGRTLYAEAPPQAEAQQPGSALERMAAERPDMLVRLPGMAESDSPIRLSEAIERIKAEADEERFTADLVRVASECALTFTA